MEPDTVVSGTLECHRGKFPGFSLGFIFQRLTAEEAGNPQIPTGAENKSPNKSLLFLA